MKMYYCSIFALAICLLTGCASNIKVFSANGDVQKGFPVNTAVLVNITRETSYKLKPGGDAGKYQALCNEKKVSSDISFLPLGEVFYVEFDAAQLGKSEFALEFSDTGVVKKVSVNSDATAGADSVTGFMEKILPFYKAPEVAADPDDPAVRAMDDDATTEELRKKHCVQIGTKVTSVQRQEISS